jgi:hypothetical protein
MTAQQSASTRSTSTVRRSEKRAPIRDVLGQAVSELAVLTGRDVVGVSAVERTDDGWRVDIEVVELERIPDTTSVLATYEVELDGSGELTSYRRVRRYNRASTEEM